MYGLWERVKDLHGALGKHFTQQMDGARGRQPYSACSFMMFTRVAVVHTHHKIRVSPYEKEQQIKAGPEDKQLGTYVLSPSPSLISPKLLFFSKADRCCLFFLPEGCKLVQDTTRLEEEQFAMLLRE